jgi:hypothetical protein
MTETAAADNDNLIKLGLIAAPTGIRNLRAYVQYYRGISAGAGLPGIMDDPAINAGAFGVWHSKFGNESLYEGFLDARELNPPAAPITQVDQYAPVVIRVVVDWCSAGADARRAAPDRRIEMFAARRSE